MAAVAVTPESEAEVWGPDDEAGDAFDPDHGMPGASAGHALKPAQAMFDGT